MKKIAVLLTVLMVMGAVPGWCLIATVDNFVASHTKANNLRPVEDAGKLYQAVNNGIDTSLDKIPAVKLRPILFDPIDKVVKGSMDATRSVVNGLWDFLTLKSMRKK